MTARFLILLASLFILAACQSKQIKVTKTDYAIEIQEQDAAFLVTFHNRGKSDLCMPFASWPGASGHRGIVESVPVILKNGVSNTYSRQVALNLNAPETKRFKRRSSTVTQLRFTDFSFPVEPGDGAYLQFDPDVAFCPSFSVPPLNR